ncbi:hypothetical protein MPTK1_1g00450 [Marchantia polymorpha subsp. ruderalis]|uniref:Gnk2-homologous domain-containing protein n=2 Tax=Marchantia polymorpha TaxID=3197 RepID=A0AAF6AJY7_MARPO|nr:hypothetical protein MARPO_0103s0042 [Marchantia polymorpha]BBM96757.1 hypothetical protein Mp_1g00450 [Marchantia polymorpha subsp. ruderalis]|eukprot:PTQ32071.1 hypothetical protein MARPO_0103s0042 [Marchantia polymorpha]
MKLSSSAAVFAGLAFACLVSMTVAEQSDMNERHLMAGPAYDCGQQDFPQNDHMSPQAVSACIDSLTEEPMDKKTASAEVKTPDKVVYCSMDCKQNLTLQECQACLQTAKLLRENYCPRAVSASSVIGICSLMHETTGTFT